MNSEEQQVLKRLKAARNAYLKRNYARAIEHYRWIEQAIQDDEKNLPIIWIELGWSYYYNHQYAEAIEYLSKALGSSHLNAEQRFDCNRIIGFAYQQLNEWDRAIEYLQEALRQPVQESTKRYAYFELGKIYFIQRELDAAESHLLKADKLFRMEESDYKFTIHYYLGFIEFFRKHYEQARRHFQYIIQNSASSSTRATGFFGLAHLFYEENDYPALLDVVEKIVQLDPNFYDKETLGFFACLACMYLYKWEEMEDFFQELKKRYPAGRYASYYPFFEEALRERKLPDPFQKRRVKPGGLLDNKN
ncbi:MAG: tetratricopeptide repeat protein [Calditrichaeota bacterium]|nr:MAG: tetratricopeptide repeat protein [Calditrichota bacterium]